MGSRLRIFAVAFVAALALAAPAGAASPDVVISQVYGGGGNAGATLTNDFVELFNRGDAAVSLDGWSVQYNSASGTGAWQVTPLAGSIAPGGRYLVQQAQGTGGSVPLPAPDAVGTIAMSGTGARVALATVATPLACNTAPLCSTFAGVRDFVGWGASGADAEGTRAPATSNTTALLRAEAGCQDSDDNAADFAAGEPAPRNSAAPATPCTGPQPPVAACGGALDVVEGDPAERAVSATDPDGRVTGLALAVEPAAAGIALADVTPAGAAGQPATGVVRVAADVPAGTYTATLTATNDDAAPETGTCTLTITVAPFDATPIGALQGPGFASPVANQTRSIEGVVIGHDDEIGQSTSGVFPEDRGLFVQDAGDGDDATSDGIFVAEILDPDMLEDFPLGTRVRVTGVVREKFNQTILDTDGDPTAVQARGTGALPAAVTLDPAAAKAQTDGAGGRSYYERFEGMRVRIAEGTANSGGTNKFHELFMTLGAVQDRVFRTDAAQDLIAADSDAGAGNPAFPLLDEDGSTTTVEADLFDRVTNVVGPMSYDFSNYRVIVQSDVVPAVDRTPGPAFPYDALSPSRPDELRVASFNVENFFGVGGELDGGFVTRRAVRGEEGADRRRDQRPARAARRGRRAGGRRAGDPAGRRRRPRRLHRVPARGQRQPRHRRRLPRQGHRHRVERAPVGPDRDGERGVDVLGHPRPPVRPPAAVDRRGAQRREGHRVLEPLRVEVGQQPGLPRGAGGVRGPLRRGGRGGRRAGDRRRRPERLRGRGRPDDARPDDGAAVGARARAGALLVPVQRPPADAGPHVRERVAARARAPLHVRALRQRLLRACGSRRTGITSPTTTRRS